MKCLFSGIQPTGIIHIGNYLGAIKNWVELQSAGWRNYQAIFSIVDLHALTTPQEPKELQENILKTAVVYLACGINPRKASIFVQSQRPEHAELAWLLATLTSVGELNRMTQYKEKSEKEGAGAGLFIYPILMAADILLYQTNLVPVGEDQKQHLELTQVLAQRFNRRFGQTFVIPEIHLTLGSRIMGLDDPTKKMSKSASSEMNWIALTDDDKIIREKIKRAVTDSGREIKASKDKPAITNLLTIYSGFSGEKIEEIEKKYAGKKYAEFKNDLAELLVGKISLIREKAKKLLEDKEDLRKILDEGNKKIAPIAAKTLSEVKLKMGL